MGNTKRLGAGVALCATLAVAGTATAGSPPEPVRLHPVDGGHWQSRVGLADSRGNADAGLVRVIDASDTEVEAAAITGFEGEDSGNVDRLGFTVTGDGPGITPTIRLAFTDALGNRQQVTINSRFMRSEPSKTEGWTIYTLDGGLPPGATVDSLQIGADVSADPPEPVRVIFDDIVVNDHVFTHPGDLGSAAPPDPV